MCPTCKTGLDGATLLSTNKDQKAAIPEPGDLTMCAYCNTYLVVTEEGFRIATNEEVQRIDSELIRVLQEFSKRMPPTWVTGRKQ